MALNEQTEMVFGDEPPRRDPVSGNEVPPGALPSEVRDDIPARLSEGEYVVPADVLQYYGIRFFEDLRTKAKTDLAELDSNGRMGGEAMVSEGDFPFSVEELNTYEDGESIQANMGGVIKGYQEGGPVTEMRDLGSQSVIKTYINDAGQRLFIRFVDGVAIPPVPPGYTEEGVSDSSTTPTTPPVVSVDDGGNAEDSGQEPEIFARDLEKMNAAQLAQYAAEIAKTPIYNKISSSGIARILGSKRQEKKVIDYLTSKTKDDDTTNNMKAFYQDLLDGIENGEREKLIILADNLEKGTSTGSKKVLVSGSTITADKKTEGNNNADGLDGTKYLRFQDKGYLDPFIKDALAQEKATGPVDAKEVLMPGSMPITDATRDRMRNEAALLPPVTPEITTEKLDPLPSPITTSDGRRDELRNIAEKEQLAQIERDRQSLAASLRSDNLRDTMRNKDALIATNRGIGPKASYEPEEFSSLVDDFGRVGFPVKEKTTVPFTNEPEEFSSLVDDFGPITGFPATDKETGTGSEAPFDFRVLEDNQVGNIFNIVKLAEANPENTDQILQTVESAVKAQDDAAVKAGLKPNLFTDNLNLSFDEKVKNIQKQDKKLKTLTDEITALNTEEIKKSEQRVADLDQRIAEIDNIFQKEEERKEMTPERIAERVERGRSGRGGFNKGGLATRKKKKKK